MFIQLHKFHQYDLRIYLIDLIRTSTDASKKSPLGFSMRLLWMISLQQGSPAAVDQGSCDTLVNTVIYHTQTCETLYKYGIIYVIYINWCRIYSIYSIHSITKKKLGDSPTQTNTWGRSTKNRNGLQQVPTDIEKKETSNVTCLVDNPVSCGRVIILVGCSKKGTCYVSIFVGLLCFQLRNLVIEIHLTLCCNIESHDLSIYITYITPDKEINRAFLLILIHIHCQGKEINR